jgi:hypothetical protein
MRASTEPSGLSLFETNHCFNLINGRASGHSPGFFEDVYDRGAIVQRTLADMIGQRTQV